MTLETLIRDYPIRRKLTFALLLNSTIILVVVSLALLLFQSVNLRERIAHDLLALVEVIAAQSTAAVTFNDASAAAENLKSFKVKPSIISAQIYTKDYRLLAKYGSALTYKPPGDNNGNYEIKDGYIFVSYPIKLNDDKIGVIYLQSEYQSLYTDMLLVYGGILSLVMIGAMLLAIVLSTFFQQLITRPILKLASTAVKIADNKDYAVRAERTSNDEVGMLTNAFNQMLIQIEAQDNALKQSRERFEVAVHGSRDGLWDWEFSSPTEEFYYSPHWKSMLGYDEEDIKPTYQEFVRLVHHEDRRRVLDTIDRCRIGYQETFEMEFQMLQKDGSYRWILSRGVVLRDTNSQPYRMAGSHTDISDRKQSEKNLEKLNQQLLSASHRAGMAEVATGVLHNVGNVLNSVNVSAAMITNRVRELDTESIAKIVAMLNEHALDLGYFLSRDARGKLVPVFLSEFARVIQDQQSEMLTELDLLAKNIEHIKEIVAMQQNYAKVFGVTGTYDVNDIIEDALRINNAGFSRHDIEIVREFTRTPPILVDRHKALQILVNLLSNAKHALKASHAEQRQIIIRTQVVHNNYVQISVQDNGRGISKENLTKIFNHGFSTRKDGHGFGLHSGANAAKEMGGKLSVVSEGIGKGANFTLILPLDKQNKLYAT